MIRAKAAQKPQAKPTARSARAFPWRGVVLTALRAAHATVKGLGAAAGQRVVARRDAGYRSWDPEVIGVDTATERAVIRVLERHGVTGTLLSEEAGERPLGKRSGVSEPVYVVMDPFDGSLLYRRGIRAHWFTALGIHGMDGTPLVAGIIDHITGEIALADAAGAVRWPRPGAPEPRAPPRNAPPRAGCWPHPCASGRGAPRPSTPGRR